MSRLYERNTVKVSMTLNQNVWEAFGMHCEVTSRHKSTLVNALIERYLTEINKADDLFKEQSQ